MTITIPKQIVVEDLYLDGWLVCLLKDDVVAVTDAKGHQQYICLQILPEPVNDSDDEYDLFVKDWDLKDRKEPRSYDQGPTAKDGRTTKNGLETNYPYIKRLRVPGNVMLAVHEMLLNNEK